MNRELKLKKYIDSLDFAIYETVLFLDTHPCDTKALTLLEKYKNARQEAICEYEKQGCKYSVTAKTASTQGRWDWIDGPWPWECEGGHE